MTTRFQTLHYPLLLIAIFYLAQCSSSGGKNIPAVGDNFCMDLDGDTYHGYYTRDEQDSDADMQALTLVTCTEPFDCDDTNSEIFPGAIETADNDIDEDCSGVDSSLGLVTGDDDTETTTSTSECETQTTFYKDNDGDGYGLSAETQTVCERPSGYSTLSTDCDDQNSDVHPGATEVLGDALDQDCNGDAETMDCDTPQTYFLDNDGDGYRGDTYVSSCLRPASNYYLASEAESEGSSTSCGSSGDSNKYQNPGMRGKDYGYLVYQVDPNSSARSISPKIKSQFLAYMPSPDLQILENARSNLSQNLSSILESTFVNDLGLPEPNDGEGIITSKFLNVDNDCDGSVDEDSTNPSYDNNATDPDATQIITTYNSTSGIYYNVCEGKGAFNYYIDADGDSFGKERSDAVYTCRKTDSSGYSTNKTDCDDENNSIFPDSGSDYSNKNGITYNYSGVDNDCDNQIDENKYLDETPTWDASVAWNGLYLYNESSTDLNTEHIAIGSYVSDIEVDSSNGALSYKGKTIYKHGIGNNNKFTYEIYHTPMKANRIFMQFYENYFDFKSNGDSGSLKGGNQTDDETAFAINCNDSNQCSGTFKVYLDKADSRGDTFENGANFLKGKKAAVFLRGFSYQHDSQRYFSDNSVDLWLDEDNITDDSVVTIGYNINFNGTTIGDISGDIFFTLAVYDPDYIVVGNFSASNADDGSLYSNDLDGSSDNGSYMNKYTYSHVTTPNLSTHYEGASCYPDFCVDETLAAGIVLKSWGFDTDNGFTLRAMKAFARPWEFHPEDEDEPRYGVRYEGWAFHAETFTSSVDYELPNNLDASVISCANTSVCQFLHRDTNKSGQQESSEINKEAF